MPIDSPFTPPHFSLTSGLGTEMEAFKSWYATSSPLFPCHCTTPIKEVTCYQWCRYKMGGPVSTWFHECLCGAQPPYTNTGCVPCFSERLMPSKPSHAEWLKTTLYCFISHFCVLVRLHWAFLLLLSLRVSCGCSQNGGWGWRPWKA